MRSFACLVGFAGVTAASGCASAPGDAGAVTPAPSASSSAGPAAGDDAPLEPFSQSLPASTRVVAHTTRAFLESEGLLEMANASAPCAGGVLAGATDLWAAMTAEGELRVELRGTGLTEKTKGCVAALVDDIVGGFRAVTGPLRVRGTARFVRVETASFPAGPPPMGKAFVGVDPAAAFGMAATGRDGSLAVRADAAGKTQFTFFVRDRVVAERAGERLRKLLGTDAEAVIVENSSVDVRFAGRLDMSAALALRQRIATYEVPSGSMAPNVLMGDHVLVDQTTKAVARGDLVVVRSPDNPDALFVKRVIAVAGDTVAFEGFTPVVNGKALTTCAAGTIQRPDENGTMTLALAVETAAPAATGAGATGSAAPKQYVVEQQVGASSAVADCMGRCPVRKPLRVPPDHLFVVGDARDRSHDSRSFQGAATLPVASVVGTPLLVAFAVGEEGMRFDRFGLDLAELPPLPPPAREAVEKCLAQPMR